MYNPWLEASMLMIQSQRVIGLRLWKLAWGGRAAQDETMQMVGEKLKAGMDTAQLLMAGGSSTMVLVHYRQIVAANFKRLSAAPGRSLS